MRAKFHYQRGAKDFSKLTDKHILELEGMQVAIPKDKTIFKSVAIAALIIHEANDDEEARQIVKPLPSLLETLL